MIILSQNKKTIINFKNVTGITIIEIIDEVDDTRKEKEFLIGADTNGAESQCFELGSYRTEERAKEILEDIINKLAETNSNSLNKEHLIAEKIYLMPE